MTDVIREMVVQISFAVNSAPIKAVDKHLATIERRMDGLRRNGLNQMGSSFDGLVRDTRRMTVGLAAATGGLGLFLNEAGQFNKTQIAFETMTGSVERGRDLLAELHDFALVTPFGIKDVEDNGAMLLGMGIEADKVKSTMEALGNVAAGINRPLGMLALNYGQVKTRGILMGTELRDFARQSVPIIEQLAKQLGVNESAIQEMASNREISFEQVEQAFKAMTTAGGRFDNLMLKQAQAWPVLLSNFLIWLQFIARDIGQELLPEAEKYLSIITEWIKAHRMVIQGKFVDFLKTLLGVIKRVAIFTYSMIKGMDQLVKSMGGWEKTLNRIVALFVLIVGFRLASMIGGATMALAGLVSMISAAIVAGSIMDAVIGFWPLLIGAAVILFALLLEDIQKFIKGDNSLLGTWFDDLISLEEILNKIGRLLDKVFGGYSATFKDGVDEILRNPVSSRTLPMGSYMMGNYNPTHKVKHVPTNQQGVGTVLKQDININIDGSKDAQATAIAVKSVLSGTVYSELYDNTSNYAVSPTGN